MWRHMFRQTLGSCEGNCMPPGLVQPLPCPWHHPQSEWNPSSPPSNHSLGIALEVTSSGTLGPWAL